jgi:multisubunit Na+/H+ antiporter MnhB subunit
MVITTLLSLGLLYLAYRIIRNGFARPQSDKLNLYGVFGAYLIFWLVVGLVEWLVQ